MSRPHRMRGAIVLLQVSGLTRSHLVNLDTGATACGLDQGDAHPLHLDSGRITCSRCAIARQALSHYVSAAVLEDVA